MTDTFQLTSVNEGKLRRTSSAFFRLPTIKALSPSHPVPSRSSATHSSKHHKSSSFSSQDFSTLHSQVIERDRARERLRKIDQEVEEDFDRLFGSARDQLLYKARSLERSPHVREQLQLLEGHVLSSQQRFNSLKSQHQSKSRILLQATDALAVKKSQREAKSIESGRIEELQKALESVGRKLEGEEAEMRKLLHMKAYRREALSSAHEPLERLKASISRQTSQLQEAIQATYHAESEAKSAQRELDNSLNSLLFQRASHAQTLESKASEYRDRREFLEMYKRGRHQRELMETITANEGDLRRIEAFLKKKAEADAVGKAFRECEMKAKTHETLFLKLGEAASAYEISDIVDYWYYLQTNRTRLEAVIRDNTIKLDSLKRELQTSKAEFSESKLKVDPQDQLPPDSIGKFLNRIDARNKDLDVKMRELETWEIYASQVEDVLHDVAASISPHLKFSSIEGMVAAIIEGLSSR